MIKRCYIFFNQTRTIYILYICLKQWLYFAFHNFYYLSTMGNCFP